MSFSKRAFNVLSSSSRCFFETVTFGISFYVRKSGARRSRVYTGLPCLRWKEDADDTAFRPKRPRCHSKTGKDQRDDDVKGVSTVAADCGGGRGRACQVKEDASIRPFLEPR